MEEREYRNSEYLRAFANQLVMNGHAKRSRRKYSNIYICTHSNIKNLEIEITDMDIGFGSATTCVTHIKGDCNKVEEFVRAAGSHIDNLITSKEDSVLIS